MTCLRSRSFRPRTQVSPLLFLGETSFASPLTSLRRVSVRTTARCRLPLGQHIRCRGAWTDKAGHGLAAAPDAPFAKCPCANATPITALGNPQ